MGDKRKKAEAEIKWYNNQIMEVKDNFVKWLKELGYTVDITQIKIDKKEETSGNYKTYQFNLIINENLKISIVPYGIWIIGGKGRIDIEGPSGSEKLVYFSRGGPGGITEIKNGSDRQIAKHSYKYFDNVDEDNWYWYDDSSYRKVAKFTKEIIIPLMERIQ